MRLELFLLDLKQIFYEVRAQDFGSLVFWFLWFVALFASLRGVDRRDEITQLTYAAILTAIGVVLILVLPFGRPSSYGPMSKIIVFLGFVLISNLRWMIERRQTLFDLNLKKAFEGVGKKEAKK